MSAMIALIQLRPWVWLPIVGALILASIFGYAAFHYERKNIDEHKKTHPREKTSSRKVKASGFKGIVRETAKFTLGATGASLLVGIASKELTKYPSAQDALISVLLISLVATILNYYMGAAIDVLETDEGKAVRFKSAFWPTVHGIIFGLSLAALLALIGAVIAFAIEF